MRSALSGKYLLRQTLTHHLVFTASFISLFEAIITFSDTYVQSMMNVEQLHVVLQQSFSPDAAVRKPAEDTIRNLKNIQGSVQLLLQVMAEKQVRR